MKTQTRKRTKMLALTALFAALVAAGAFIRIPIGTVPVTLQFVFANLAALLLGVKWGTLAIGLYIALGLVGVPIFTAGGGFTYVLQPTFGYLLGFLLGAFVAGLICYKGELSLARRLIASFANLVVVYAVGVLYLGLIMKFYMGQDVDAGAIVVSYGLVFLPMDSVWAVLSSLLAPRILPYIWGADSDVVRRLDPIDGYIAKISRGGSLSVRELKRLKRVRLARLCDAADRLTREYAPQFELCAIVNAKCGGCGEDCAFCAQSARAGLMPAGELIDGATYAEAYRAAEQAGIKAFSAVTSCVRLGEKDLSKLISYISECRDGKAERCASLGLLSEKELLALKEAGLDRYHNNLESSAKYFPKLCTTHTYAQKKETIKAAMSVGLKVCSGGIIGAGESMNDRISMALELRALGVTSVPVNILCPIKGTPLGDRKPLAYDEIRRTVAILRFALPYAHIRIAGGRASLPDKGEALFKGGANAAISGDYLTTSGVELGK